MSQRIRLLFLTDTYLGGFAGSERYLEKLCRGLNPDLFRVKVTQLANKPIPYPQGELAGNPGVTLEQIGVNAAYGKAGRFVRRKLSREFHESRFDIVHSLHEKADLLSVIAGGRVARVSGRRDIGFKKGKILRTVFRYLNNRFDRFVVPATAIADGLVSDEGVSRDRVEVIPNGLDLDKFQGHDGASARRELGLTQEQFVVGCIANLNPVKRHDLILTAFSKLTADIGNARLLLVGKGDLEDQLRRQADQLGISEEVRFLGQRADVPALLAGMDVVVSASDSEGLSNSLIESAAAGVPVIATGVGGSPEIVDNGQTGVLVPTGSAKAITDALRDLYRQPDLRMAMSAHAIDKAKNAWSLASMIDSHQTLYQSLATK